MSVVHNAPLTFSVLLRPAEQSEEKAAVIPLSLTMLTYPTKHYPVLFTHAHICTPTQANTHSYTNTHTHTCTYAHKHAPMHKHNHTQ